MKPLVLTMEAFGSYGQKTTIDFNDLNQNLFLITGDTGSGKSTIFDAIVFAIYGEASSNNNKKDGRELQSQYTGYTTEPYVALTFSELSAEGDKVYTIRRVPRHFMQMKRKDGVKEVSEKVSLTMPDGTVYPEKETDKKIEEIVGLTKSQFMQIAMIAQGEFMELLRAKSDDKKVIFRKLFHTELYQDIVNEFANRKKAIEKEMSVIRTVCQTEASHITIPAQYDRSEALQALKSKITTSERISVVDLESLIEELQFLQEALTKQYQQAKDAFDAVGSKKDAENDAYAKAETLHKFFVQLDEADTALKQCSEQEQEILEKTLLTQKILAAYEIQPQYHLYQESARQVQTIEQALSLQQAKLPELQTAMQNTANAEQAAGAVHETEVAEFTVVETKVAAARKLFQAIADADAQIRQLMQDAAQKDTQLNRKEAALKELEDNIAVWKQQEDSLKDTEYAIELLKQKKTECNNLYAEVRSIEAIDKDIREKTAAINRQMEVYKTTTQQYDAQNAAYEQYRKAFFNAQAGIIAREELKEGLPCPVCGAVDHPNPCKLNYEDQHLTRDGLDQLAQSADALRKQQEMQSNELQSLRTAVLEKTQTVESALQKLAERLREQVGPVQTPVTIKIAHEAVQQWIAVIKAEDAKLQQNYSVLQQVRTSLADSDTKLQEIKAAIELDKDAKNNLVIALETKKAELANYQAQLEYNAPAEADAAYEKAKVGKDAAEKALQQAKLTAANARTEFENAKTLIEKYQTDLPNANAELQTKQAAYQAILLQQALEEETWQALTARYTKQHCEALQREMKAYEQKKVQSEALKASAENAIAGQTRPNLTALEQNKKQAEASYQEAQKAFDSIKDQYRINGAVYEALVPKMEERKELVAQHTRIDTLYKLLSGNVTGSRMDIETYVQRYYMEQILYAANSRFQEMSAGQFELRMYDLEKAGEGKNRGLDLIVYSNVTGKEREVRTLSGGESFMAALALALGMADQIQEKSSAINLDIMFIDEGFGSLDDYSREQAVKVLREMANGSKLIGIISHVTELKQQIDNQLVVKKDEQGSHVRWQIS